MTDLGAILWAKRRIAAHSLAGVRHESYLKVAVLTGAALLLWLAVLYAFLRGFHWLQEGAFETEATGDALSLADILMVRLLAIFALALFFLLIFSNTLIAFSTLYKAREVSYLVQAPIEIRTFFLARFVECVAISSWASAYLGSPIIIAYGFTTGAHLAYYLAAVAFYTPFVMIPAAIGCMITLVLVRVFPRLPRIALVGLAFAAILTLFLYVRRSFSTAQLTEDSIVDILLQATAQTQSSLLPSFWLAQGVLAAAEARLAESLYLMLLLLANALFLTWLASELAQRIFLPGYSSILGGDRNQDRPLGRGILGRLELLTRFVPEPMRALVVKDVRLFWRDPTQWSQFVIFFGIMAIYVSNLRNRSVSFEYENYRSWVASLNSGACALILASLTSRFVYPLISLEGFRFWILGLAPLTLRQLVWQKFWLSVVTTSPFTIGITVISCYMLDVTAIQFVLAVYSIALANLTLAGLAVGLGSIYPNFEEDNPARIVSGLGGTLNFLMSIGYIALLIGSQMIVMRWYSLREFTGERGLWAALAVVFLFVTILSLIAALVPMRMGLRNLERTEF